MGWFAASLEHAFLWQGQWGWGGPPWVVEVSGVGVIQVEEEVGEQPWRP